MLLRLISTGHGHLCLNVNQLIERIETMTTKPNLNLLNEMAKDIYSLGDVHQLVQLRDVKEGEYFRRKPTAAKEYIREHYNRSDKTFTCTDSEDIGRCIFLKADTLVCVERYL